MEGLRNLVKMSLHTLLVFFMCLTLLSTSTVDLQANVLDMKFTYASESSNAQLFYSINGGFLQEIERGSTIEVGRGSALSFYTKVKEGYSAGTTFLHRSGAYEASGPWTNGTYGSIANAPTTLRGYDYTAANSSAVKKGCAYQFHYTSTDAQFRVREFKISAHPVDISIVYDMNGATQESPIDANKYAHSNIVEAGYLGRILVSESVPTKAWASFEGWTLLREQGEEVGVYKGGDTILIDDVWATPSSAKAVYTLKAKWKDLYSVSYYQNDNDRFSKESGYVDESAYERDSQVRILDYDAHYPNSSYTLLGWSLDKDIIIGDNIVKNGEQYRTIINFPSFVKRGATLGIKDSNIVLYAVWATQDIAQQYTITTSAMEGAHIDDAQRGVLWGMDAAPILFHALPGFLIEKVSIKNMDTGDVAWLDLSQYPDTISLKNVRANYDIKVYTKVDTSSYRVLSVREKYDGVTHYPRFEGALLEGDSVVYSHDGNVFTTAKIGRTNVGEINLFVGVKRGDTIVFKARATVEVEPRNIVLRAHSATKKFDGTPLTKPTYQWEGDTFASGEGASSVDVVGMQSAIGSSRNEIQGYVLQSNTEASNYHIVKEAGTLSILALEESERIQVHITSRTDTRTYNAQTHDVEGFNVQGLSADLFTMSGVSACASGRNAGVYTVDIHATPLIVDKEGRDVTSQFAFTYREGSLTIQKAMAKIVVGDENKWFARNDPTFYARIEGVYKGDEVVYTLRRDAGEWIGKYTIYADVERHINYKATVESGMFNILENTQDLKVRGEDVDVDYDALPHSAVVETTHPAALLFKDENGKYTKRESPSFTQAGAYEVFYKVELYGYTTHYGSVFVRIQPRDVYLVIYHASKVVGAQEPVYSANVQGLIEGDKIVYTLARDGGEEDGVYTIAATYQPHPNYNVHVQEGTLRIIKNEGVLSPSLGTPTATPPTLQTSVGERVYERVHPRVIDAPESVENTRKNQRVSKSTTPKSGGIQGQWALLNLVCTLATLILSLLLLSKRRKKDSSDEGEEEAHNTRGATYLLASALLSLVALIAFIFTQDMSLEIALVDMWSTWMLILLLIQCVVFFRGRQGREGNKKKSDSI